MIELDGERMAEFYRRSFTSADGLWFMKVEEKYGFDNALEIDNEVWKVMPKIQARMLKSKGKLETGMEALFECFTTKLNLDGFSFSTESKNGDGFKIVIDKCPWHDLLVKSGRGDLSEKIGPHICNTEYSVWASEFNDNISYELQGQICQGAAFCTLQFSH